MLKGKIAIVTCGSRGIGAAVVQELAEKVCQDCRDRYGVRAGSYCCNVADFEAAKETVAKIKEDFGRVDILINNAGGYPKEIYEGREHQAIRLW